MIKKINLLFVLLCVYVCITHVAFAKTSSIAANHSTAALININPKDSTVIKVPKVATSNLAVKAFRDFESLKVYDELTKHIKEKSLKTVKEGFKFETVDSLINKKWLQMANNTFATIDETQNYVDVLSEDVLAELPVAIRPKQISNVSYTVGVAKAVFKPAYTELILFLKIDTPKGTLILGAKDIKLSHEGGIVGEAKLSLISKFTMNFDKGKVIATLKGSFENPETYALIDCYGFKELGISADVLFSQGLIHPVDAQGKAIGGYVSSSFKTVVGDWNDIVVNISLPEFGIKGLKGTTFRLNNAVLDFSDLRNDASMPETYLSKYYKEQPDLWRGVYISTLEVVLPREFKKRNQDRRITFESSDLIIDTQGVTGHFYGEDIISIEEGSASKWQFSLDRFLVDIETNTLKAAEFNGEMILPVSKEKRLKYDALIQPDDYTLRVTNVDDIDFDVWNATVLLEKESHIELKVKDGDFLPKANLHGKLSIGSALGKENSLNKGKKTVDFKGITFQNLRLQTESPKLSVDYFGYKGNLKLANFPASINEIGLRTPEGQNIAELIFDFNINLTTESDGANGGGARLIIESKLEDENGRERWKFDGIDLERISIAMDVAGTQLKGSVFIFEDDPVYGTGFAGAVGAKFSKGLNLEVNAKALFGRTQKFRYWFADAQAVIPGGIPIFTGFSLNTFGGGVYNRMRMAGITNAKGAAHNQIGASTSGIIYEPDNTTGLGMKAMVGIATQNSEDLFHASVEFGMTFLKKGGLKDIYFKGHGELVSTLPSDFSTSVLGELTNVVNGKGVALPASPPSGAMSANVFIGYDFTNNIFQATSELYVNFGILKGVGTYGRAGWLDFYVSPDEWHLLIGTPKRPVGIVLNLGLLKVKTRSYFMTGDDLPSSLPPPTEVANILGLDLSVLDNSTDLEKLKSGRGLAFGSRLDITTGDLKFLIFYARFDAGLGFDITLKDYENAHCKGASEQIGLNGWYASGQAYAYLQGELGLFFKLFGKKKKIPILKGGAAVIVQARLPNPAWFQGYMGGQYNLLGGLIKGRFRFKLELGEKCEVVGGSPIDGIVVIGDMTPKDNAEDVDVFAVPQVVFNMQLNKVFEIPDETGDRKYKIILDDFSITKNGNKIKGDIEWNSHNDVMSFYSHEILPPNSKLKSYVQLHFEEFINGRWEVIKNDGKISLETKEVNFKTGAAPVTIPLNNVAYMYPVYEQQNFFIEEYKQGYINLKKGQSYLFEETSNWKKNILITSQEDVVLNAVFKYNSKQKQIVFERPENMKTSSNYKLEVVLVPPTIAVSSNVDTIVNRKELGGSNSGNTIEIKSKKAKATLSSGEQRKLLAYNFHTSDYKTFKRKMNVMRERKKLYNHITYPYGLALLSGIDKLEPFDIVELKGSIYTNNKPLVVAQAVLEDAYYKNVIYPLLYQNYPLRGKFTVDRETDKVSVPPVEGVEPISWYLSYLEQGLTGETSLYNPYRYNLTNYYYQDYLAIQYKLVNSGNYDVPESSKKLITDGFPLMKKGKYKTTLKYVLPGQIKTTRTHEIRYTNPLYE